MTFINITYPNGEPLKIESRIEQTKMNHFYNEIFNNYYDPTKRKNILVLDLLDEIDRDLEHCRKETNERDNDK